MNSGGSLEGETWTRFAGQPTCLTGLIRKTRSSAIGYRSLVYLSDSICPERVVPLPARVSLVVEKYLSPRVDERVFQEMAKLVIDACLARPVRRDRSHAAGGRVRCPTQHGEGGAAGNGAGTAARCQRPPPAASKSCVGLGRAREPAGDEVTRLWNPDRDRAPLR